MSVHFLRTQEFDKVGNYMAQVSSTITINAPADAIWRLISDFGAAGRYLSGIVDCTVEGEAHPTLIPENGQCRQGAQRLGEVGAPIHSAEHIQRFVDIAEWLYAHS